MKDPLAVPTIDDTFARRLAEDWVAAWNSNDLETILAHYTDDFEMRSPLIAERGFSPDGVLRGKPAIRPYWSAGLQASPPIRFELLGVYAGVSSISIHYKSIGRKLVVETLELDPERRVIRGSACYGAAAD
jgi:SnoaL-like domain